MHAYCLHELHLSEEAAFKRIRAARTARRFPAIFPAVAEGRLHLSAVVMLSSYLTPENADELMAASAHRTKSELGQILAQRFPQPELPAQVLATADPPPPTLSITQLSPGPVDAPTGELAPGRARIDPHAPGRVGAVVPRVKVAPIAPQRFTLQLTIDQNTYDRLQYAQALLSHQIPAGEIATVLDRALVALIEKLEQRKFTATSQPRAGKRRATRGRRHIPADVKRTVWQRDGGQCTFVSDTGRRCVARTLLEFDHIDPVARGGQATVERMRLRCRAHNHYEAECTFGAGFMGEKRDQARRAAAETRARAAAKEQARDVVAGLRELGFRADEARRAAEFSGTLHVATLEERVRAALKFLSRPASTPSRDERGVSI
ncbi:MAG TPA: hypothetical protein VEY91_11380 [Candidatus Limnocylindria bacterium]|nr:hypothetical protein [Candidatus Limnocylindria bacterium]